MARAQKRPSTALDDNDIAHPYQESSPQSYKLGARSCRGCHQRKVRCDRGVPCTNCSRCGIACVYPTKDQDVARKITTLENISNRLERLEVLLSSFLEGSQVTSGSAADRGGGGSQTQIQVQHFANVNAIETANQLSSKQRPYKSTWQLLLNDGQVVQSANNSNIEILIQNVSLDFLEFLQILFPSIKLSYDKYPQANIKRPPGTENQDYSTHWLGNSTITSSEENKCSPYSSSPARWLGSFTHGF
jgi:hypothetical protein